MADVVEMKQRQLTQLLIGCGTNRDKRMGTAATQAEDPGWGHLVTCDINPDHDPDVIADLRETPWPFESNRFDEVHAYEVLEHLGAQGDYVTFFAQFSEIWRILKPGGKLLATTPSPGSPWVWGDPSHTRAIFPETLIFLSQAEYAAQCGKNSMSDFRYIYKADFIPAHLEVDNGTFSFILEAVKS